MSEVPIVAYFCTPSPGESWNALAVFAKCKKSVWYAIVQGSCNIAADLYIFVLPLDTIHSLQMDARKKLGVYLIFGVGLLYVELVSWALAATHS